LRRTSAAIVAVAVSCVLTGCGYKTSPRPASASIPGSVGLVDAHAYPQRVVLRWDVPTSNTDGSRLNDLSGFRVYRSAQNIKEECEDCDENKAVHANVDLQQPTSAVVSEGEVVYSDMKVEPGKIYAYAVSAYNLKGRESPHSEDVKVNFDDFPPAPRGLGVGYDQGRIVLNWASPPRPAGIRNYRIYRGSTNKPEDMKPLGRTKWAETTFSDKDVQKGQTYYYVVRSLKMNRGISLESDASDTASATAPRVHWGPPENVNTMATGDGIRIVWAPVKIEDEQVRYNVYRSESGRMFEKINTEPVVNPSFLDKDVRRGASYRYAISAFVESHSDEESSRSASEDVRFAP